MQQPSSRAHLAMRSALLALALLPACNQSEAKPQGPPPTPQVEFVKPTERILEDWDEFTGRLEAVDAVQVRARVGGYLQAIHFTDGQQVEAGQLLFELDPRPFAALADAAKAEESRAAVARDLATLNLERGRKLLDVRAIAAEDLDQRNAAVAEAEAALAVAKAHVAAAQLNLDFTQVLAPISGRISDHRVSVGNQVSGGSSDSTVLTTIVSTDPIYCAIEASEDLMLSYLRMDATGLRSSRQGQPVPAFLALGDETDFPHEGVLDFVNNQFDEATATLRARAKLDNPEGLLLPGMFARLRVSGMPDRTALLVPDKAVQTAQNQRFVLVVSDENVVQHRPVQVGVLTADGLREITTGITKADQVIVAGLFFARPGTKVAPRPAQAPAARQ